MDTSIETKVKESIHARTDAAARAVHDVVDRVAKRAEVSEDKLRESADQAQQKLQKSLRQARAKSFGARDAIAGFVRRHPFASAGIALGLGALWAARAKRPSATELTRRAGDGAADNDEASVH